MHVVRVVDPPFVAMGGALRLHVVPAAQDNLIWIAECVGTGACAVVDGPDADGVLAYAESHGLRIEAVWNTHTHGDHVGINRDLIRRNRLPARVVGPARAAADVPGLTDPVGDGDEVVLGDLRARVLLTEGHIDGHVSFVLGDVLFCGDTLFTAGCGFLFSGPAPTMFRSLLRLAELPDATRVCCGHEYTEDNLRFAWWVEPDNAALADRIRRVWAVRAEGRSAVPSTIEEERATNPFLRPGSPTLIRRVAEEAGRPLRTPDDVFAATRALKDTKRHRAIPDAALPL